ncbi:MAG TPA: hypothetical protein VFO91_13390 [Anaerolineales bacterium]|nr:hypothetical protein [Anaerolineales bacterium]
MTLPALLLGVLAALFYGALYHLIRGGSFWRLLLYLFLSVLGFAAGYVIGLWRGWVLIPLGSLNFGLSTIGSLVILILGDWLSHIEAS